MTARHAHLTLVLALLAGPAWAQATAEPADVCKAVTVREGDPIPDNACAVNIVPRTPGVEGIVFGTPPAWQPPWGAASAQCAAWGLTTPGLTTRGLSSLYSLVPLQACVQAA